MSEKVTAPKIAAMRENGQQIVCITAYDYAFGALADAAGADLILVGDSLGNVVLGYDSTVPVTMEDMVHHTKAVRRGVKRALLVADMPFGSYQSSVEKAVDSAILLTKAGAEAVKLEGDYPECLTAIQKAGIPVMGHVGMTPQSVHRFGGHRVQGKGDSGLEIKETAMRLSNAGAFAIVLELIPSTLAKEITDEIASATIGIGAGPSCNGQIQVLHDLLGLSGSTFRHAKSYLDGHVLIQNALEKYTDEVRKGAFPTRENSF